VAIGLALGMAACWTDVRPAPPDLPPREGSGQGQEPEASAAPEAAAAPTASVVPEVDTEELGPPLPTITFAGTEGASEDHVKRWFAQAPSSLSRCKGEEGHMVRVYISARGGDVHASLDESNADAGLTSCVLEVVAFELDNGLDNLFTTSTSPSERPNAVESVLILKW